MTRQTRHALTALTRMTPARRSVVQAAAVEYLSQVDRRRLPVGYDRAIGHDDDNRADAFTMRRGNVMARLLGLGVQPHDPDLPDTARAVLAAIDTTPRELTKLGEASGQSLLVAALWLATK
ncbi:hypothetical protein [Streptomyces sp. CBMA152]|uniref:hypothetical protein n=1 Tax=Streptomyces sp. CBMA152 TaxID=1896312 RepID=UPI001660D2AB|nr:hypothetical protein [Streptomyces sp. CBMA152]MBD0743573.1 hypothetical protein [Streptomyces sp. CBMA152]